MSAWAIIPAAGTGARFGGDRPKPLAELAGRPLIAHTLAVFEGCPLVDGVILLVHPGWQKEYAQVVADGGFGKVRAVVAGGATRGASVQKGLAALGRDVTVVLVHDGVRQFVTHAMIAEGLKAVQATGAAVAGVPVKPTVKSVDPRTRMVVATLERELLWEAQTPQVFERGLLERAYSAAAEKGVGASDDAALVESDGGRGQMFPGAYTNIKVTTPDDMIVARAFLK